MRDAQLGKKHPDMIGNTYGRRNLGQKRTLDQRVAISEGHKGLKFTFEHCDAISDALTGRKLTPEHCAKVKKGCHKHPNKKEKTLEGILNILAPGDYEYNGDYRLGIKLDRLTPDFVNMNGQKKVIDFHGNHWHKKDDTISRAERYAKCGWQSIVVWQSELHDLEKLQDKLIDFMGEKT